MSYWKQTKPHAERGVFMDNRTERQKYLRLLAQQYPNVRAASSEIIHLQAILSLPKGT